MGSNCFPETEPIVYRNPIELQPTVSNNELNRARLYQLKKSSFVYGSNALARYGSGLIPQLGERYFRNQSLVSSQAIRL